jgi:hypothetical protein
MVAPNPILGASQCALEDRILGQVDVLVGVELRTDVIDIGNELAAEFPDQIQKTVTVEVDPYQAAGDAALVA